MAITSNRDLLQQILGLVQPNLTSGAISQLTNAQLTALSVSQLQYILNSIDTPQFLQDNLTVAQRNDLNEIYTLQTGQTTSFATGDDGNLKQGRLIDFTTLKTDNIFGNANRFTNDKGGSVYDGSDLSTANYLIDNSTGLGWCITVQTPATWADALTAAASFTLAPYTTGWELPNLAQLSSIADYNIATGVFNYAPFSSTARLLTSTTEMAVTTNALSILLQQTLLIAKSATTAYLLCRIHFII